MSAKNKVPKKLIDGIIADALETGHQRFDHGDPNIEHLDPGSDEETFPLMKISEPVLPVESVESIDTEQDTKDDYDLARKINLNLLQQQQEMIKSMANFLNAVPSPRAYEVMNNMMKTAMELSQGLLSLQTTLKEAQTKEQAERKNGNTFIFTGGPSEILEQMAKAREAERRIIDVTINKE